MNVKKYTLRHDLVGTGEATCEIRIYTHDRGATVVMSDPLDNEGVSVRNKPGRLV